MWTLNVKRTVIFLVVVIVIVGSAHLLHSYQVWRNSSTFKAQAEAAWNDTPRRPSDSVQMMKVYLLLEPRDYEAREELGFWYLSAGAFSSASATLEELVRTLEKQDPPDVPVIQRVRRKAIDAAMAQGRCQDAVYHLEILKKELPDDADVLNLLGKCKVTLRREDDAVKNFSEAIQLRPERVDIYHNKAMTLRFSPAPKLPQAEKCMAEMIAYWDDPKPPAKDKALAAGAHHVYGMWLSELGKNDEAAKQAKITLALRPDHPGALYLAGQSELAQGHFPKAEEYARRGIQAAPQEFAMYTLMADVMVRNNQRDKAIEVLKKGIETTRSKDAKAQIQWHLANLYLDGQGGQDARDIADAVDCMRKMRESRFSPVQMAFLDARVLYANDEWKSAREGFEKVRPRLTDFPRLMKCLDYWIGYCYLQQGNPDQAMAAFRRSLSFDKFYFKAHDGIAQIFLANNQVKDAAEEYRQVLIGNPHDAQAALAFAKTLVVWNLHRSPAEQDWNAVLEMLQKLDPRNGQIALLKAEVFLAHDEQLKDEQLRNGRPDDVREARWRVLLAREPAGSAEDLIKNLVAGSPKGVDFWVAKANLAVRRGKWDAARKTLDEAQAKLGDHILIRLARAVIVTGERDVEPGAEIEKLAGDADAFSRDDKIRLWNGLLKNLMEIREYDRAKQICRLLAREQPHDAVIRYRLFELALLTHNVREPAASLAELDRLLDEIDVIAGRGPLWMYGKAVRLKLESDRKPELLDAALDCARKAQQMRLAWSRPHVLQGEIWRQRGNDEQALDQYLQASINGDRDLEFIRLLLQMLFERQRYQEAEQVIHRLDSVQTPLTPEIDKEKAQIEVIWGVFDRALECAGSAYNPASDDYREHVWHGQVLKLLARRAQREGHQDKLAEIARQAEKSFRRACQIAPNAAECRVGLVQLLVATDQRDKARIAANDAEEMISLRAKPLAMGYIYEALGENKQAGEAYQKAVNAQPDQPQAVRNLADFYLRSGDIRRATPLIERVLSGKLPSSESDLVSARRMMAAILVNQGYSKGYSKMKEAARLVDRNLESTLAQPEDKRLKILILLADPRQARGPDVLELAESLVNKGAAEPEPDDRLQLARLYLARGDWEHCREQMEKLVNGTQSNPHYLAAYVRMLLDQNQLSDADMWLERLEKAAASNPGLTVDLHAELLQRRKEWGKVPGFLAAYVSQAKTDQDRLDRMLVAAQCVERLGGELTAPGQKELAQGYFDKARAWYESYVQKRPGSEMLLAAFHARRGKIAAALDLLEQFGAKASPLDLATAAVAVIHCENITARQLQQVEKVLAAAVASQKESVPLLTALAELKTSQGKFAAAEDLCRQMLAKDPQNYLACNNLGVLLALSGNKLDEALAMVDRAIELAGPLPLLLDSRAVVRIARNEPRNALEDLASIAADKPDPVWLLHKARALWLEGQGEGAVAALAEARNKGLQRALIDPPERPFFDQLEQQLVKRDADQ